MGQSPEKGTVGTPVAGSIEPVSVLVSVSVAVAATVSVSEPFRRPVSGVRGPESGCFNATK